MLNETSLRERDLSATDLRTISPEQWHALKREVIRRAHAGRSEAIGALLRWLGSCWQIGNKRRDRAIRTAASSGWLLSVGGRG
jgi:hypothetical protein